MNGFDDLTGATFLLLCGDSQRLANGSKVQRHGADDPVSARNFLPERLGLGF
ncbi:hypothetical protein N5938_13510 [Pseudomonas aeruginosa]|uniref:hypothetical protein n=1 Tax=Pseudomonas aeruginosa TaxID=287 RepID=UPI000A48236D|nr:hypothetical protein [Pseudomonas aeruginosa]UYM63848.1 hypothetical protein N5938_13510 [Pseudomonas aeruginosa]